MRTVLAWFVAGVVLAVVVVFFGRSPKPAPQLEVAPFPSSWRCTERPLQQGSGNVRVCEPPPKKEKSK